MFEVPQDDPKLGNIFEKESLLALSDENLLSRYRRIQDEQSVDIQFRDGVQSGAIGPQNSLAGGIAGAKYEGPSAEEVQDRISGRFASLNALRAEIERRGLEAPTMEDLERGE